MSLVESKAAFRSRCDELDETGNLRNLLAAQQIESYSSLAFTIGTPQSPPTEAQFDAFTQRIHGAGATMGQTAKLKQLHFEATALVIESIKQKVSAEGTEKLDSLKKIPAAEKRHRLEQQETRLAGLKIVGELNPSHHLIDLANNIIDSGSVIWIAPSKCTKRDDEVQLSIKERSTSVQVENQLLKVTPSSNELIAEYNNELKLQWCLQRRGIAMDQCRLLSWAVHESWVSQLLTTSNHSPPPGFQSVKADQLIRADRELWTVLAQTVKGSLKPNAAGVIPLDSEVEKLRHDPRILQFLLPLPSGAKGEKADQTPKASGAKQPQGPNKQDSRKRKRTRAEKQCPEELKQFNLRCDHGPVCWAYNLKDGCKSNTSGKPSKCNRGYHVCANGHKPGHSVVVCRALTKPTVS